jgi:aspartate ammonia-lyase
MEQLDRLRVSDTLAVELLGDNDSQYQAVIENDNENHSQATGRPKPQRVSTGATG